MLFKRNPRRLLGPKDRAMVDVWRRCSPLLASRQFAGRPPLPDAGGVLDQPAVMNRALEVMDACAAALLPPFLLPVVMCTPPDGWGGDA